MKNWMHTEMEASQKCCPIGFANIPLFCYGSKCMWWKWYLDKNLKKPANPPIGYCGGLNAENRP